MKKIQQDIFDFVKARGWEKDSAGGYAKSIAIEAAELLEHFQWTEPSAVDIKADPEKLAKIQKELADVFIYSFDMCNLLGLDAEEVVRAKMEHNGKKYPVELVKGNPGAVKKLQQEWRQKGIN